MNIKTTDRFEGQEISGHENDRSIMTARCVICRTKM